MIPRMPLVAQGPRQPTIHSTQAALANTAQAARPAGRTAAGADSAKLRAFSYGRRWNNSNTIGQESSITYTMSHAMQWEHLGLKKIFWGRLTPEEFECAMREALSNERFSRIRYSINDFTSADVKEIDGPTLERVAMLCFDASNLPRHTVKVAVIGAQNGLHDILSSPIHPPMDGSYAMRQFICETEARRWIAHDKSEKAHAPNGLHGGMKLVPPKKYTRPRPSLQMTRKLRMAYHGPSN